MSKMTGLRTLLCLLGLIAAGCSDKSTGGGYAGNSGSPNTRPVWMDDPKPQPTKPRVDPGQIVGTAPHFTGRATQAQPKALESLEKEFHGTASAVGAGTITVNGTSGNQTFTVDNNTFVCQNTSRNFAIEGGVGGIAQGTEVFVIYRSQGGQNVASMIRVGPRELQGQNQQQQ